MTRAKTGRKGRRLEVKVSTEASGERSQEHNFGVIATAVLGVMLSLPFLITYHHFPITSFYSEWLVFLLALLAFTLLASASRIDRLAIPAVVLAPLFLGIVVVAQAVLDRFAFGEQAVMAGCYLALAAMLMITGATLRTDHERGPPPSLVARLAWFVLAGGVLNGLAGILQYFSLAEAMQPFMTLASAKNVSGTLAQSNHFANHLALALGSLVYLFAGGRLRFHWADYRQRR